MPTEELLRCYILLKVFLSYTYRKFYLSHTFTLERIYAALANATAAFSFLRDSVWMEGRRKL